jgi:hypothetical protein
MSISSYTTLLSKAITLKKSTGRQNCELALFLLSLKDPAADDELLTDDEIHFVS